MTSTERATSTAITARQFDVFLSHNGREKPLVERIAVKLKRAGLEPWLDIWHLTPGAAWLPELHQGLMASRACAVCIGPAGLGDWAREEVAVALERAVKDRGFRVFLVLLPGLEEPFNAASLPAFLSTRTWVDLRQGIESQRGIQALINAIMGVPLEPVIQTATNATTPPYRGLQAFDERHAEYFFGRDADIQRLIEQLKESRFLAVLGPSGVGKSSVVRAGLVPALRGGRLPGSAGWHIRIIRPGARPLTELAVQLAELDSARPRAALLDELAADARSLDLAAASLLARAEPDARLVWVVDQFEEVFTLCHNEVERRQFLDSLLHAATIPGGRTLVILTMRADFYPRCATYPELAALVANRQYLVSAMDQDELRQAIEEPARLVGLELEHGLVETILDDIARQPGALPLLEHALFELWERRRGSLLTLEGYRESGGVQGAIAKRAETIYAGLDADRQDAVRRVLLRLTEPGEGTEDTRRRAPVDELVSIDGTGRDVDDVLDALIAARLLTVGASEPTGEREVDVAHEALIRAWPRLRAWIDEDRAGLREHRRITEAAREWQRLNRDEGLLFRGARLAAAVERRARNEAALNSLEREFLDMSLAAQERERRAARTRQRWYVVLGSAVVAIAVAAAVVFYLSRQEAQTERDNAQREAQQRAAAEATALSDRDAAERARRESQSRELAAIALAQALADPELSLLLAVEAVSIDPSSQAVAALRRLVAQRAPLEITLPSFDADIGTVAFSADSRYLALADDWTTGTAGPAYVWDLTTGDLVEAYGDSTGAIGTEEIAFSPDGRLIVVGYTDGTYRIWDRGSGTEAFAIEYPPFSEACQPLAYLATFSADGKLLATAHPCGEGLSIWDVASGQLVSTLRVDEPNRFWGVQFSPDGQLIATQLYEASEIRVWEARTGNVVSVVEGKQQAHFRQTFSLDSRRIVTAALDDGSATIWDIASGSSVRRLHSGDAIQEWVAYSPNGALIVTTDDQFAAHVWDADSGSPVTDLVGHSSWIEAIEFSANSRWIMTTSIDHSVRIWDSSSGELLAEYSDPSVLRILSYVLGGFSPDGRWIYLYGSGPGAMLYSTAPFDESRDALLARAATLSTRELTADERAQYLHEGESP
jgi:WD40 repeat protein